MINKRNFRRDNRGVTLIELMAVIAMIGILAGITLVSLQGQRERAKDTKILAELSATIQPMLTCWSDGNQVYFPTGSGGANICSGYPDYGTWPRMNEYYTGNGGAYQYTNGSLEGSPPKDYDSDWSFFVQRENGSRKICCSKEGKSCAIIPETDTCTHDLDLTVY